MSAREGGGECERAPRTDNIPAHVNIVLYLFFNVSQMSERTDRHREKN